MTVQQLQFVLEVAKTKSITQAARNLFLSQPNLSSSIKSLEEELGITIFDRTSRGMLLTTAGKHLVKQSGTILSALDALQRELKQPQEYHFRVNISKSKAAFNAFVDLCEKYQAEPKIQLSSFSDTLEDPVRSMEDNQYDVSIFAAPTTRNMSVLCGSSNLRFVTLVELPMFIWLSKSHPLAQPGAFSLEKLRQYPFVTYTSHTSVYTSGLTDYNFIDPTRLIRVESNMVGVVSRTHAFCIAQRFSRSTPTSTASYSSPFPTGPILWAISAGQTAPSPPSPSTISPS